MKSFGPVLDGVSQAVRDEMAADVERTCYLNFGQPNRTTALYFRIPAGEIPLPPAGAFLQDLAVALRAGGPVRVEVPRSLPDRIRIAECLAQSAARPHRDGRASALEQERLWRAFETGFRLPADQLERQEHMHVEAAQREVRAAAREAARLRRTALASERRPAAVLTGEEV